MQYRLGQFLRFDQPVGAAHQRDQPEQRPETDCAIDHHGGNGHCAPGLMPGEKRRLEDIAGHGAGQEVAQEVADHSQAKCVGKTQLEVLGTDEQVPAVKGQQNAEQTDHERRNEGAELDRPLEDAGKTGGAAVRRGGPVLPEDVGEQSEPQAVLG